MSSEVEYTFPLSMSFFIANCHGVRPLRVQGNTLYFTVVAEDFLSWFSEFEWMDGFREAFDVVRRRLGNEYILEGVMVVEKDDSTDEGMDAVYRFEFNGLVIKVTEAYHAEIGDIDSKVEVIE